MSKTIYKKTYKKETVDKIINEYIRSTKLGKYQDNDNVNIAVKSKKYQCRRMKIREYIIKAIKISNENEIDIEINESPLYVSVKYILQDGRNIRCLKDIIALADNMFIFSEGNDMILLLEFFSHIFYKEPRRILFLIH